MILALVTAVLLLIYCALIIRFGYLWRAIPLFYSRKDFYPSTKISVIVAARNEEKNIDACIQSLQQQDYPRDLLQIIVVDDESEDETFYKASSINDSRLLIVRSGEISSSTIPQTPGKKRAIATAIEYSTGSLIVTTDADCIPPVLWLKTIAAFYEEKRPAFIAAPVMYSSHNNFSAVFQALDFISLQGITAAGVHHGLLMMSNGANLAYEKKAYYDVGGFSGIDQLASGDDLLLMQKIAQKEKSRIVYCHAPEAIVPTQPAGSWTTFLQQRFRWASKARFYADAGVTWVLVLVYVVNFLLLVLLIVSFLFLKLFLVWVGLVIIKTIIELLFMNPVARFFNQQALLSYFFPSQPLHIIYTVIAGFFGQVKRYEWKGRKVK